MLSKIKTSFLALVMLIFSNISYADDIDILTADTLIDANILFVMDLSGSMNTVIDGSTATRLEELSGAFQAIISDDDFNGVNFGLSVFSGGAQNEKGAGLAHGITYPVSPVIGTPAQDILTKPGFVHPSISYMPDAGTTETRQYLSLFSSDTSIWNAKGATPIVDALYEASLYFRGEDVHWGRYTADDIRSAHPSTYVGALANTTTTTTPACTDQSRQSCTQGSCGATESCSIANVIDTRSDPTGGTNCSVNTGRTCTTSGTSCGLGTNCSSFETTSTRWCDSSITTVAECLIANPSWESCSTFQDSDCTTDDGVTSCTTSTRVRCEEVQTRNRCDAADSFTCEFPEQACTMCPEDVTETIVTGNAVYKSPIIEECAANGIILLTDGAPTRNRSADLVASMIGSAFANNCNSDSGDGRCGPELAGFMSGTDHADGTGALPDIDGIQSVSTYAVGLALDVTIPEEKATKDYLDAIALNGNGSPAIIAGNQAELTAAFKSAISDVVGRARSFSSPSYSIDTSTLLTNGPYVYIPVFDRSATLWPGNLKKYKLVDGVLTDADNKPALDDSGALLDTAKDLWATNASVDSIRSGGVANKINPSTRNILSDDGTDLIALSTSIPNDDFGLSASAADTTLKDDLVTFISGLNPADDSVRNHMGDIIHSKPVQLTFDSGRKTIFVGSNEGYLHAVNDYDNENNALNGTEAFAYMPKELLKNIKDQYSGTPREGHLYGVDNLITVWIDESANSNTSEVGNGIVDVSSGEKAYVFFGLRRGGNTYTALDVTDPDSPELVWSNSFNTANSWSQPVVANLKWKPNTTVKPVVIIGGGFNDDDTGEEILGEGNNVYVIDALNGNVIWDTSDALGTSSLVTNFTGTTMPNAVPSRIRVIDLDRDNSVDRLYFGDTGGNIWRVDLNAANFDSDTTNDNDIKKAQLHRVAALGGTGVNDRQFFEEPDVAIFKRRGKLVSSIAIGSGSRPNPLSATVQDKFYVLYDTAVTALPTAATNPLITSASSGLKTAIVTTADSNNPDFVGWQRNLTSSTGEKVLSSALTFQGKVLFTTFATTSLVPDACNPSNTNENTTYVLDIFSGIEDGVFKYPGGEILDTPKIVYPPDGTCIEGNCKREPKLGIGKTVIDFPTPKDANGNVLQDIFGNPLPAGGNTLERVYWIDSE